MWSYDLAVFRVERVSAGLTRAEETVQSWGIGISGLTETVWLLPWRKDADVLVEERIPTPIWSGLKSCSPQDVQWFLAQICARVWLESSIRNFQRLSYGRACDVRGYPLKRTVEPKFGS